MHDDQYDTSVLPSWLLSRVMTIHGIKRQDRKSLAEWIRYGIDPGHRVFHHIFTNKGYMRCQKGLQELAYANLQTGIRYTTTGRRLSLLA